MNASRNVAEWFAIFEENVVFVVNDKRPGCCCLVTLRANDIECDEEEESCRIHVTKTKRSAEIVSYVMASQSEPGGQCMQTVSVTSSRPVVTQINVLSRDVRQMIST